jgi:hypothetical protein
LWQELLFSDWQNSREDVAMMTNGMLRPMKHSLANLVAVKTLKSVIALKWLLPSSDGHD